MPNIKQQSYTTYSIFKITIILILIFLVTSDHVPHPISNDTFNLHFHMNFEEFKSKVVTPSIPSRQKYKTTEPDGSFLVLFYNPLYEESLEMRSVFHQFFTEYENRLVEILRRDGAKQFEEFQAGIKQAVQIGEVDCNYSEQICKFFKIQRFPTLILLTGPPKGSSSQEGQRQAYSYVSSVQGLLPFTFQIYSRKILDLSKVQPIEISSRFEQFVEKAFQFFSNQILMYIICFLIAPFVFGYFFMGNNQKQESMVNKVVRQNSKQSIQAGSQPKKEN